MKLGRFVVATHVHGQRHAARMSSSDDDGDYSELAPKMGTAVPAEEADEDDAVIVYDNSDRLLFDMEAYDVDMGVLLPAYGMENTINERIMEQYPDRFVASALAVQTRKAHQRGEEEWTWERALSELDEWLSKDGFEMIGETVPTDLREDRNKEWPERREELRRIFELAADHDAVVRWHTGQTAGYGIGTRLLPDMDDPTYAGEIKQEFPDVPIVFDHGGKSSNWREHNVDRACQVAASWDDVYLEIGLYWADLLKKPYHDPNIGPEQMLWGGDWGASMPQVSRPGQDPSFYWDQVDSRGLVAHQPDYWGAGLRQLLKFALDQDVEQDKLNLILGGNAARLLDLEVPETRLFEQYLQT